MNDKERLLQDIARLREELAQAGVQENFAESFQALSATIDQLEKDADLIAGDDVSEQLDQYVTQFEVDHPQLSAVIRKVMETLANIGI